LLVCGVGKSLEWCGGCLKSKKLRVSEGRTPLALADDARTDSGRVRDRIRSWHKVREDYSIDRRRAREFGRCGYMT